MQEKEFTFREMFCELSDWEGREVPIIMKGSPASPMQVVAAHMAAESPSPYMRDYVFDEKGNVKELCFHEITSQEETDSPMPDTD